MYSTGYNRGADIAKKHLVHPIITPLALVAVGGTVWYSLHAKPQFSLPIASVRASTEASKDVRANIQQLSPLVQQAAGQVSFSVNTAPFKHVERVEFYVENRFVGVAYAPPYVVSVDQANMTSGSHTVVARVYTPSTVTQTTPTSFTNVQPASTPPPADPDSDVTTNAPVASTPPPPPTQLGTPTTVVATANADQSVDVSWTAATSATSYQIWRDGSQIGTATATSYHDSGLTPGQTYDYVVVAVDSSGNTAAADPVAVTVPTPPPDAQQQLVVAQPSSDTGSADETTTTN